jgi:hypothetical protein
MLSGQWIQILQGGLHNGCEEKSEEGCQEEKVVNQKRSEVSVNIQGKIVKKGVLLEHPFFIPQRIFSRCKPLAVDAGAPSQ